MSTAAWALFAFLILLLVALPEIQKLWHFLKSFDRADRTEIEEDHDEYPCL